MTLGAPPLAVPRLRAPPGACDCHMHVYPGPFPAASGSTFDAPHATAAMYREVQAQLGLERVIVVQANGYGTDNAGLIGAMADFGAQARGVAIVAADVGERELHRLTGLGVRGVRFHMLPGGALQWPQLESVVARVRPFGWHAQVQLDGHTLVSHADRLLALPVDVVIDHVGKFLGPGPASPDAPAFRALQRLLDGGRCWVKLSAPYESSRSGPPGYDDVSRLARALVGSHPERCVWASNWPHAARTSPPADAAMLDLLLDWASDDSTRHRILVGNPARLYGFT